MQNGLSLDLKPKVGFCTFFLQLKRFWCKILNFPSSACTENSEKSAQTGHPGENPNFVQQPGEAPCLLLNLPILWIYFPPPRTGTGAPLIASGHEFGENYSRPFSLVTKLQSSRSDKHREIFIRPSRALHLVSIFLPTSIILQYAILNNLKA